jgi:hypothetical protein
MDIEDPSGIAPASTASLPLTIDPSALLLPAVSVVGTARISSRSDLLSVTPDVHSAPPSQALGRLDISCKMHLPYSSLPTGVVYDSRMRYHTELEPELGGIHPEDPRRVSSIFKGLLDAGLVIARDACAHRMDTVRLYPNSHMLRILAQEATEAQICAVHTSIHFKWVMNLASESDPCGRQMRY